MFAKDQHRSFSGVLYGTEGLAVFWIESNPNGGVGDPLGSRNFSVSSLWSL